ncbi:hypothetical protein MNEG_15048, partial [Monoraphidium neglectum]
PENVYEFGARYFADLAAARGRTKVASGGGTAPAGGSSDASGAASITTAEQ